MRSVPMFRYRYKASFSSRPTPSCRFFSTCLLELVPRPPGVGCAGVGRFAAAVMAAACLLASLPCRSLALARSLFWNGSPCWVVLLGCLVDAVPSSCSSVCSSLAGGWRDAGFCVPLALSVSGPPSFPVSPFRFSARWTGRVAWCVR